MWTPYAQAVPPQLSQANSAKSSSQRVRSAKLFRFVTSYTRRTACTAAWTRGVFWKTWTSISPAMIRGKKRTPAAKRISKCHSFQEGGSRQLGHIMTHPVLLILTAPPPVRQARAAPVAVRARGIGGAHAIEVRADLPELVASCEKPKRFAWWGARRRNQNPVIIKVVCPEPCKEFRRRPQLFLAGTALTNLHLPGF